MVGYHYRADAIKYYGRKLLDLYNEYAILVLVAMSGEAEWWVILCLVLTTIATTFANGGRTLPKYSPGKKWFGEGLQHIMLPDDQGQPSEKRSYWVSGATYTDSILRAATPLAIAGLTNLAQLRRHSSLFDLRFGTLAEENDSSIYEVFILVMFSQCYIAIISFALICVIEANYRCDYAPLGQLREKIGIPGGARLIVLICQALCCCILPVINWVVYILPGFVLIPIMTLISVTGTFLGRFGHEPVDLALSWQRSNLHLIFKLVVIVLSYLF
eukprot:CAMPEP_0185781720 /NCGR_PEP_ID=MMETSP1174-20130828/103444_1 /TAXON_ID=35687 /ORGANISM="Dictyocha speculum, Strain CCMP1381" /LENGTH=271 /DNA_ID=CAMNT_0028471815 /DNA_START=1131 /DNA_END=1943 /DNA_ORIENTATION=-